MSEVKIGQTYSYGAPSSTNYVTTTTSNYVAPNYSTSYGTGSGVQGQYTNAVREYATNQVYTNATTYPTTYTTTANNIAGYAVSSGIVGQSHVGTSVNTGKEVIKGQSRIEYVPFEKKVIDYRDEAKIERVPKKVKKVEYREERKIETIPKEVTVTDYYAVEYLRQYIPQYVPEKRVEYVQVPKKTVRYEYIPVERQIVHYPDQSLEVERTTVTGGQKTQYVSGGQYAVNQTQYVSAPTGYVQASQVVRSSVPAGYTEVVRSNVPTGYTEVVRSNVPTGYTEVVRSNVPAGYTSSQGYTNASNVQYVYEQSGDGYYDNAQNYINDHYEYSGNYGQK